MHCCVSISLTSSGLEHIDELLGVSDVERRDGDQAVGLPHLDTVGEADKVKPVAWTQVPQDSEQGILSLREREGEGRETEREHFCFAFINKSNDIIVIPLSSCKIILFSCVHMSEPNRPGKLFPTGRDTLSHKRL